MIRFSTYDEAHLFASRKRAEGYFAEVIHENAGHFWCASVVGGFPVLVSTEALPEDACDPEVGNRSLSEFGLLVAIFGLLGFALFAIQTLIVGYVSSVELVAGFVVLPLAGKAVFVSSFVGLFLTLWVMLKMTRVYNRQQHPLYRLSRFLMSSIMWFLIIAR